MRTRDQFLLFGIHFLLVACLVMSGHAATNVVPNGDMERGIWNHGAFARTGPQSSWATDSRHSGRRALKMTARGNFYGYWQSQEVPVNAGKTYQVSLWVRTEAITKGVTFNISWRNAAGRQVRWEPSIGGRIRGTRSWHAVQGQVRAPAGATKAWIQIRVQSTGGRAWVDDAAILSQSGTSQPVQPAPAPKKAPAPNPTNTKAAPPPPATSRASQAVQNQRWEATLKSTVNYTNPFKDVDVSVEYTKSGRRLRGFAFWDGGSTFKIRQAFPEPGTWTYKTTASDRSNAGLHNRTGTVEVRRYTGTNPLYKHGFLRVSGNKRYLEHADGTPFLWVGETLWGATMWLSERGFQRAIDVRRRQSFTVLQTNFARKAEVDTRRDTPWDARNKRWNVRFMQKVDRMFNYANDKGMYLFINGLVDLLWDRNIREYKRLVEMIAIRYGAHHLSYSSSMDDPYDRIHDEINTIIDRVTNRHLLTQHPGSARDGSQNVGTAEQYYNKGYQDYVMAATGGVGNLERGCQRAIEWSLRLYNRSRHKPVVNSEAWYEGLAGGTGKIASHLAYLSLLSGQFGYTYGTDLWNAKDRNLGVWQNYVGATYMQNLYDFFLNLDDGRPLVPRHHLVKNQKVKYSEKMVAGVSQDGKTYAAFLPQGGTIKLDLRGLRGSASFAWYHTLEGRYAGHGTTTGGSIQTLTSPFRNAQAALVLVKK